MKKLLVLSLALLTATLTSCTSVESGHHGVIVEMGGKTDMTQVLDEGFHWGYTFDKIEEYDTREQTVTLKADYNDKDNQVTPVEVTIYFKPMPAVLNKLHKEVGHDYKDVKLMPLVKGALKEVIPQFSAQGLNKTDRNAAESKIKDILDKDLASIYVNCSRVSITDVDIPKGISDVATQIATQESRNVLASKREAEKTALASALIAESKGKFEAAQYDAKTKDIMSQPKMLELLKLEIQMQRAKNDNERAKLGKSEFGENNVFGIEALNFFRNK